METKQCTTCSLHKSLQEFEYRGGGRKGLQAECKECSRVRARDYRRNMRQYINDYKMSLGCQVCGFQAVHGCQLDLDHIDPSTKTYKGSHRAVDPGWSQVRVDEELAKCVVTCKNCHALRTYTEEHWKNAATTVRMR